MSQSKRLAEAVSNWLLQDLKLDPDAVPPLPELERICRGNMVEVFKYLVDYVHNTE